MTNLNLVLALSASAFLPRGCEAFAPPAPSAIAPAATTRNNCKRRSTSPSRLYGINEWRDQALELKYTLDAYQQSNAPPPTQSGVPATVPILPFPFADILLQGQRKQLNLYEKRFHDLFQDAMDNHCGMVGMGLLAGAGMITTLPLCEVESFSRFGAEDDWVDRGDGMGNGSIFVTIRAVGRCKIVEADLLQEEPYMKARVVELLDEDVTMEGTGTGLKEKIRLDSKVVGESSPIEVASMVAGNIENMMVSLASMEHKLKEMEEQKKERGAKITAEDFPNAEKGTAGGSDDEVMNRRILNAQLDALFMQDSNEGVDIENSVEDEEEEEDDDEDDDEGEDILGDEDDENGDRVAQFQRAFESAKETDSFGYVVQQTNANDNPDSSKKKSVIRTPKDLTAISWAAFCTGERNNIQRDVMKIQALDMTNVLQRLQLASAMLREEKKKWRAKLALAGIKDADGGDDEGES